jgi:PadR family transcriptional regulator PadR
LTNIYIEVLCIGVLGIFVGEIKLAISKDLVAASATPLILSILSESENYGYAIIKRVRELSNGRMQWTDGMLYPVLHRLEEQKLIQSKWRESKAGRKRKYYKIKKEGTKALTEQKNQWNIVYSTLRQLWENEPCLT